MKLRHLSGPDTSDTEKEKIGSISAPPTKASGVPCKPEGRSGISLLILSRTSVILS